MHVGPTFFWRSMSFHSTAGWCIASRLFQNGTVGTTGPAMWLPAA